MPAPHSTAASSVSADRPAIVGGEPLFPNGPPDWPGSWPTVAESVERCLADGSWGKYCGPHHNQLEAWLRSFFNVEHALLCASGTAAVELALRGAKVDDGDDVLLAGYDFKANFQNVLAVGATPLLVDVRADTMQLDVDAAIIGMTESTKAIIASHLHGGLVDLPQLKQRASERGILVIEDACQCPGAKIGSQRAGAFGDVGVLSFGGSKLLSAGRGGAVLTNSAEIAQRIRLHTQRGNEAYPLSELQAAALLPQCECLDEFNAQRLATVQQLRALLPSGITLLANESPNTPAFYKVGLLYEPEGFSNLPRDSFINSLQAEGIAIDSGFRALHRIHSRRRFKMVGPLPNAERADTQMLVLHHPLLRTPGPVAEQLARAIHRVRDFATTIAATS